MKLRFALLATALLAASAGQASADLSQLGASLTAAGAVKAGNADGSIPAYGGSLTTPPASYQAGSGHYVDPFAAEKALFSIDAKNMGQYADKLTEGTKALMQRYPAFRIDVYPTHRSYAFPGYIVDNTLKGAGKSRLSDDGMVLQGAHAQVAFPVPQTGLQAIWNHLTRYSSLTSETRISAYNIDASGGRSLSSEQNCVWQNQFWLPDSASAGEGLRNIRCFYTGPARRVGEALMTMDVTDSHKGRRAWQYLPGQRRVRLAPDVAFDTPNPSSAGVQTYDDVGLFNGSTERYDWKLVGRKEIFVPYNAYRAAFESTPDQLIGAQFANPERVRFELHRVWVVEADLKDGMRHIYKKRRFYLDEDSWTIVATENYDARNDLFKVGYSMFSPLYDKGGAFGDGVVFYDLIAGNYSVAATPFSKGAVRLIEPLAKREWSADALSGAGVR